MADEGRIHFSSELSDKGIADGASRIRRHIRQITDDVERSGQQIDQVFSDLGKKIGQAFAVSSLIAFQKKIIDVRGEMEALQISFETLAGERVGRKLYEDIKQFATTTPMMMKDLAKGAQTLLGFNMEAEKVMPILRQIGDISMGDAQKFNSLTLAFAQMSSTGKLMGQDLLQMINAGFNPLVIIAEKTGKSIGELKDEMSQGRISVEMVEEAFRSATSEGGKFYGMLEKQSKGMAGALSNLKGAYEDMLNDIGTKEQGVLVQGINLATEAVKHYETFARILLSVVAAYGSYKAVLLLTAAAQKAMALWDNIRLMMMFRKELGLATAAQQAFNLSMKASPVGLLIGAVSGIAAATMLFSKRTSEADEAQKKLNTTFEATQVEIASERKNIDDLFSKLRKAEKGTDDYKEVKDQILSQYGQYLQGLSDEISTLKDVEGAYKAVAQAARDASLARGKEAALKDVYDKYGESYSGNIVKIQDALVKSVGQDKAGIYLKELQDELSRTGTISEETTRKIRRVTDGEVKFGWIENLKYNEKYLNDYTKLVEQRFQVQEEAVSDAAGSVKTLEKAYKEAEKAYKDASKKVSDMSKNRAQYTAKEWKEAQDKLEAAKKAFKDIGGDPEGKKGAAAAKKEKQQAIKDAEAEEKILELKLKQQQENARREKELRMATAEAEIQLMADGSEKKLAQLDYDRDRELEAIEAYYEDLRQKRIEEAKQLWDADPTNKGRNFFDSAQYKQASSTDLSFEEAESRFARINAAWAVWQRGVAGVRAEEVKAMNDYLKAYGKYQEKRQAIADEYNTRIQDAKTEGERLALQKELENETHALDEQYGLVTQSMADLFADASKKSVSSIQKVIDKYEALVRFMQGQNGTIYGSDGKAVSAGSGSVTREDLKNMGFSDSEIKGVQDGTISIKELTDRLKDLKGELKDRSPYKSFTSNMKEVFKQFKDAKNADDFGTAVGNMCGEIQSFLPEIKEFGQDIANIFGVDNSKFTAVIEGLDGLVTAGQGVGQIMSGDIVGGVMNTVKGISQMVDALDGAFGADYSSYNRLVEQYDKLIGVWDDLISKKEEYISMSYGAEAAKVGSEAIALVEREAEAWRKLGKERLNAGASAGSHAIGRRMAKDTTAEDWENIARALGVSVGSAQRTIGTSRMTGLFDLTADQLQKLKEEAPEFWARMDGDVQKYLQSIIDGSEMIAKLNEQTKEQLTSITFDSMYDSFVDLLSDMDASSQDFAKDFEKYMFNAMLSTQIGQKYKKRLQSWYDQMAQANEDSMISEGEIKNLRDEWDAIVSDARRERDSIAAATGYNSNSTYKQESSVKGFQAMSQDMGEELNGRFTALQIAGEGLYFTSKLILENINAIYSLTQGNGATFSELRNLAITRNSYLEDIAKFSKGMYNEFKPMIQNIQDYTSTLGRK